MRDWSIRNQMPLTKAKLAELADLASATIYKVLSGVEVEESVFAKLGQQKALDREPKSLWKHRIRPVSSNEAVNDIVEIIIEHINDNDIRIGKEEDLRILILSGKIPELRGYRLSIYDWEDAFDHLQRRGHLYRRYNGTLGIASFTTTQMREVVDFREEFECKLVENFAAMAPDDQSRILDSLRMHKDANKVSPNYSREFFSTETRVHLCWCGDNYTLRDSFGLLLRKSMLIADQLQLVHAIRSRDVRDRFKTQLNEMPGDLDKIIEVARNNPSNAAAINEHVKQHTNRVRFMIDEIDRLTQEI